VEARVGPVQTEQRLVRPLLDNGVEFLGLPAPLTSDRSGVAREEARGEGQGPTNLIEQLEGLLRVEGLLERDQPRLMTARRVLVSTALRPREEIGSSRSLFLASILMAVRDSDILVASLARSVCAPHARTTRVSHRNGKGAERWVALGRVSPKDLRGQASSNRLAQPHRRYVDAGRLGLGGGPAGRPGSPPHHVTPCERSRPASLSGLA